MLLQIIKRIKVTIPYKNTILFIIYQEINDDWANVAHVFSETLVHIYRVVRQFNFVYFAETTFQKYTTNKTTFICSKTLLKQLLHVSDHFEDAYLPIKLLLAKNKCKDIYWNKYLNMLQLCPLAHNQSQAFRSTQYV